MAGKHEFAATALQEPPVSRVASAPPPAVDTREFVRFPRMYRALHACMVVSFLTLAVTGLSLKFSYTAWAVRLSHVLGGFETAGYIHRFAAIIMFGTFAAHVVGLVRQKRRNQATWSAILFGPNTLIPTKRDAQEFVATMKWFVGLGPRPEYGRWTYWEKFDYFAVFWGIVVIGSTADSLVPGVLHGVPAGIVHQRGHHHPQ